MNLDDEKMNLDDEILKLDKVESINQICEAAKKNDPQSHGNVLRVEYMFEGGERVDFPWELSLLIEGNPVLAGFYDEKFEEIIGCIKAEHAKGLTYHFQKPPIIF